MNFFEHQEKARKSSGRLVLFFFLAVGLIVATCYLAVQAVFVYQAQRQGQPVGWWNHRVFWAVAVPVMAIILFAALTKMSMLKKGGAWVAQSLGGKQVLPGTKDPAEKRYLNVVEEMALAAGVPVPPAFLLEGEEGINAFAAGNSPADAAVAVTRGCLDKLNRDELQGVIAHEFSHIVNGDMRLNIKLMGFLAGILALAVVGWHIIRFAPRGGGKKDGNAVAVAGIALIVLGYGGVFVGRLIQSAVSRQREYLADASAVQFTRNPVGIAGALKKIGGYSQGSLVNSAGAREASHMFFGEVVSGFFSGIFATHPPLAERIKRVDPQFNPELERMQREKIQASAPVKGQAGASGAVSGFAQSAGRIQSNETETIERTGQMNPSSVERSRQLDEAIPERVRELLQHPLSASAVIAALLMDKDAAARQQQLELLSRLGGEAFGREIAQVFSSVLKVPRLFRLPLIDLAMPTLRMMSARQANQFRQTLLQLALADNTMTLSEFAILKVVESRLAQAFQVQRPQVHQDVRKLSAEVVTLLTALAWAGNPDKAQQAFRAGVKGLATMGSPELGPRQFDAAALSSAFDTLSSSSIAVRKTLLRACAQVVLLDGEVSDDEAELLRAVAYGLELPLPPFLPRVSA